MPRKGQNKEVKSQPTTGRWLRRRRLHPTLGPEATWHLPGLTDLLSIGSAQYFYHLMVSRSPINDP